MSWQPKIINHEQEKIQRTVREDTENLETVLAKGEKNIVVVGKDKFVCPKCEEGWTFARMNTIVCCGIKYVKNL